MSCLTEYRKPRPRYGAGELAASPWRARGGWFQAEDGSWRRIWTKAGCRTVARRAVAERRAGWWVWRVEEFETRGRRVTRCVNRSQNGRGHLDAAGCFPFADLAARG